METLYMSDFNDWYSSSGVRSKPRRQLLSDSEISKKLYWVPELAPISQHQTIASNDELRDKVLLYYLYCHLNFTIKLENEVVNSAISNIFTSSLGITMLEEMQDDAYKIYCDEAYHACSYIDLKRQVESFSKLRFDIEPQPIFLKKLHELKAYYSQDLSPQLIELFFVIVSETLISSTLKVTPRDTRVHEAIRQVISDHAIDEAYHHKYFSKLFTFVWPQILRKKRTLIGQLLPKFIWIFLEPDHQLLWTILLELGIESKDIEGIIRDTYEPNIVQSSIRKASAATVNLMLKNGVLEDTLTANAFKIHGLT
jgi:hypothetical protein